MPGDVLAAGDRRPNKVSLVSALVEGAVSRRTIQYGAKPRATGGCDNENFSPSVTVATFHVLDSHKGVHFHHCSKFYQVALERGREITPVRQRS